MYTARMSAFLTIAVIHLLALASPGPDFAIIVQHGVTQSRRITLWTALGIALGILVHVTYSLLGIGLLISQSILLFNIIKYLGAAYLLYLGVKALLSNHQSATQATKSRQLKPLQALMAGFLCNALNPKVTLFFLAVFTQVIAPATPVLTQLFYGTYMAAATFAWFSLLGTMLTASAIRRHIDAVHAWAERLMGVVLIALGLKIALSTRD